MNSWVETLDPLVIVTVLGFGFVAVVFLFMAFSRWRSEGDYKDRNEGGADSSGGDSGGAEGGEGA